MLFRASGCLTQSLGLDPVKQQIPERMPLDTLCFIHIPKTAGTSFREAAVAFFGEGVCQFDYGPLAPETSGLVRAEIHDGQDPYAFGLRLADFGCRLFGGHFHVLRYASLFRAMNLACFVREPVSQILSHYAHHVRHRGYTGSLESFMGTPNGAGVQSWMLSGIPVEALGFVGVTERYAESLRVFNWMHGVELTELELNAAPPADPVPELPPRLADLFRLEIDRDNDVYGRANAILDERLRAMESGRTFVHGALTAALPESVAGFAFAQDCEDPVGVQAFVGDEIIFEGRAVQCRPLLKALNVPREGFVGFSFRPPRVLLPGEVVTARVSGSGQPLSSITVTDGPGRC